MNGVVPYLSIPTIGDIVKSASIGLWSASTIQVPNARIIESGIRIIDEDQIRE
jgi:hypothetical protein